MDMDSWKSLSVDLRCEIIKRMPPDRRLLMWMVFNEQWSGLFRTHEKTRDIEYIARIWSARDAVLETRIKEIVGEHSMICAAALLGHEDYLMGAAPLNVAYWLVMGGHETLLRNFISRITTTILPNSQFGSLLWTAAAIKNNGSMATKFIEWRVFPSYDECGEEAFRSIGIHAAGSVADSVLHILAHDNGADHFIQQVRIDGMHNMLSGCIESPKIEAARELFTKITDIINIVNFETWDLINEAFNMQTADAIWYVRYIIESVMENHYHHFILDDVIERAIQLNNNGLVEFIVGNVEWELSEMMLWSACEYGTPAHVSYLLENEVPRSARAYERAMGRPDIIDALIAYNVPVEDMYINALVSAVSKGIPVQHVERFIELGCSVTYHVLNKCRDLITFNTILRHIPEARHAEYKDYVFYDALGNDDFRRIHQLFANFDWRVPDNFYYRCCMLDASHTFRYTWDLGLGVGGKTIEEGLAHQPALCEYAWARPNTNIQINWETVIATAIDQRKQSTLRTMENLIGPKEWQETYDKAALQVQAYIPFPDLTLC